MVTRLVRVGRHNEAIAEMKRAMEVESLSLQQGANFAAVYMYARQFDLAVGQARKTYDLDPSFVSGQSWLCHTYNAKGMYTESLLISEKSLQSNLLGLAAAGYTYAKSGRPREAEGIINRIKEDEKTRYVGIYWLATTYTALGEKDAAFAELEKTYQARDWFLPRLKTDPFMDPLARRPALCGSSKAHWFSSIGVGRDDWFRSPSLRTGQAVLPHPALQLVVHLRED